MKTYENLNLLRAWLIRFACVARSYASDKQAVEHFLDELIKRQGKGQRLNSLCEQIQSAFYSF